MAEDPPEEPEQPIVGSDDEASLRIDALRHDVERERGDKDAALRYVEGLEDRFAELSQEYERLGEESIRTGTRHRETIEEVLDQAAGLASDLAVERARLAEAKAETQAVSDRDRVRVEELLGEAAQLAVELAQSREHIGLLTDERDDRDVQLRQLQVDSKTLMERSKTAEESVNRLQSALKRAAEVHAEQLRKAGELHNTQLEQLKVVAQEQEAERTTQSLEAAHNQANRQLEAATKAEQKLSEDLDNTRTKLAASRQEVEGLSAELADSRQQVDQGEIRAQQLQKTNDTQASALQQVQETSATRAAKLADAEAKLDSLQAEANWAQERLNSLTEDHEKITLRSDQERLDTQDLEAAHNQANRQLEAATKTEQKLAEDLDNTRTKLAASRQEVGGLTADLASSRQQVEQAEVRTQQLQKTNDSQASALQQVQETGAARAAKLADVKAKLGTLQAESSGVRERLRILTEDHEQLTLRSDQERLDTQQAKQTLHTLTLDFERSQTEVADLTGQLGRAESRAQDADNRTHSLQAELAARKTDLQAGADQLSGLQSRLGQLEAELMSARALRVSEEANAGELIATELQTLHEKSRAQAADLESKERQAEALEHAAEDREREVGRLTARLTSRESELEAQREIRKDLEARLTDALARLGKTEDLVEEARMLESQRMEAPPEASDEPPVHHDPEAERHIAWLQTELIRANRDGDRRLEDLTATLRRAEQQLEMVGQRERALQEQLRTRGEPGVEVGEAQDNPDKTKPGRRLRPPRW